MNGQTEIPQPEGPSIEYCSWCEERAVVEIQVQPAWVVKKGIDTRTGRRLSYTKKKALLAPACEDHAKVERVEPVKKERKKVSTEQQEFFPKDATGPSNAQFQ